MTSRLEFFRQPAWMKQWPFAHTIEITHLLQDGVLEVRTKITNIERRADAGRDRLPSVLSADRLAARRVDDRGRRADAVAAGRQQSADGRDRADRAAVPEPARGALKDYNLDDVFGDLVRDAQGRATMTVIGKSQRLDVVMGPNFRSTVIYAPAGRDFICFEPMAGITNAINLAHKGLYKELQSVPPGGTWQESFWVRPSGF